MSRPVSRVTGMDTPKASALKVEASGSLFHCYAPDAVKLEVYTMDATKLGEARFADATATVKVDRTPAAYLYIVTYPDGRRESGKVMITE